MSLKHSIRMGFSFGFTSAIITTLGLMVGLNAGTHSTLVVIGGIVTIGIADAFSDALGMHIAEESQNEHTSREIWAATISTFLTKFIFAMVFVLPVLMLNLENAIIASIAIGLVLLAFFSYILAKAQDESPVKIIGEHVGIAIAVIAISQVVGDFIATVFV